MSRLALRRFGYPQSHQMETQTQPQTTELPLRPQDEVECRRCEVHCDKVVYPAACAERGCPFLYAYEEFGHTYVGCMQRVFEVDIDLELLLDAQSRREGFGAMRVTSPPLPLCQVEVEACYESRSNDLGCVNPEFHELPVGEPSFRIFAQIRAS